MTKSRDAAKAIIAVGNFVEGEPLEGYLTEIVGGTTVLDRSQALVQALDYLGVLRGDHPAPHIVPAPVSEWRADRTSPRAPRRGR